MGYKSNGVATEGLPIHLVQPLLDNFEIPFLVETGTASGDSVRAVYKMFPAIYTIELIENRQDKKDAPSNVVFLVGDSSKLLPQIIANLLELKGEKERQYVLFYLDAHYSDDVPNESGYPECPVLDEIRCIAKYGGDAIIIIDDARLFLGQPPYPHDPTEWPSIKKIFELLIKYFPYHHITLTDDYILAIPLHVREPIDAEWRERFHIRYPNEEDKLRSQYKDVWEDVKDKYSKFLKYVG